MAESLVVNEIYLSLQGESTFAGLPCVFVRLTACNLRCSYCDTAYAFAEGSKRSFEEILRRVRELAAPYSGMPGETAGHEDEPWLTTQEAPQSPNPAEHRADEPERGFPNPQRLEPETRLEASLERGQLDPPRTASPRSVGVALPGAASRLPLIEFTGGEPLLQLGAVELMRRLCVEGFTVLVETSGALDISGLDPRVHRIMDLKCPSSGEVERNRWANLPHLRSTDEVKFVIGTLEDYAWAKAQVEKHQLDAVCPVLFSWVAPLAPEQQHPALKPVPAGQTPLTRLQLVERIIADALPVRFQLQMHKIIWAPEQRGV